MKKIIKTGKKFGRLYDIVVFLFVLGVFIFSFIKVYNYLGKDAPTVFGSDFSCGNDCGCPSPTLTPCPSVTPTPTLMPTPTPTPISTPTPIPTEVVTPTPTPTEIPRGGGNGGGGNGGGGGQPYVCSASTPIAPTLLGVDKKNGEAVLTWSAVDPVTHYAISYGLTAGNYQYGVANTGKTTSFTIGSLNSGQAYCFVVRGVNDCAPGNLSNEICTGRAIGGQVLGATTLAATGDRDNQVFQLLFAIGTICLTLGLRLCLPVVRTV